MSELFKVPLTELYIGYLGRAPESLGLIFWKKALENGLSLLAAAQDVAGQPETLAQYPYLPDPDTNDLVELHTTVFDNHYSRAPNADGLTFWVSAIEDSLHLGTASPSVIDGAVGDDVATLQNRIQFACDWVELAEAEPNFVLTEAAIQLSQDALTQASADPSSVGGGLSVSESFFNDPPTLTVIQVMATLVEATDTADQDRGFCGVGRWSGHKRSEPWRHRCVSL